MQNYFRRCESERMHNKMGGEHKIVVRTIRGKHKRNFPAKLIANANTLFKFKKKKRKKNVLNKIGFKELPGGSEFGYHFDFFFSLGFLHEFSIGTFTTSLFFHFPAPLGPTHIGCLVVGRSPRGGQISTKHMKTSIGTFFATCPLPQNPEFWRCYRPRHTWLS
jgi:hypothetical protein